MRHTFSHHATSTEVHYLVIDLDYKGNGTRAETTTALALGFIVSLATNLNGCTRDDRQLKKISMTRFRHGARREAARVLRPL